MLRNIIGFSSIAALALTAVACSGAPEGEAVESSASGLTDVVDQVGIDAQVLQVWSPGRLHPRAGQSWNQSGGRDVTLDASTACPTLETRSWSTYTSRDVDCVAAFASAAPFDGTNAAGPVMTPIRFNVSVDSRSGQVFVDPDYCTYLEVRVVVREAALAQPSFAGVGFWTSRGERFAPKNELQEVGQTRLANGDGAKVFRFTGISTCISSAHSSTSGNMYQTFSFKPYAAYDVRDQGNGDVKRFRVWERIEGNHTLGRSWPGSRPVVDSAGFDRQGDLLAR